jgi:hypothetical protein
MSDLDHMLQSLGRGERAPEPPPVFLAAVGRRRRERRIKQLASVAAAVIVVVGVAVLLKSRQSSPLQGPRVPTIALGQPAPDSLSGLTRLNPDLSVDGLRLPAGTGGGEDVTIQLGMRWEPAQVEQWVSR